MKSEILGLLAAGLPAAGLLAPSAATGAPLAYEESISGDIPGDGTVASIATTFTLDVGINTVAGTQSASGIVGDDDSFLFDVDPFRFVVPVGAELHSFSLAWNNGQINNLALGGISSCVVLSADLTVLELVGPRPRCVELATNPAGSRVLFSSSLPLAAGTYGWYGYVGANFLPEGGAWSWSADYVLSMALRSVPTTVPEPGSLALLGLGLAGLGLSRRRKAA